MADRSRKREIHVGRYRVESRAAMHGITGCNGGRTRCLFDLTRPRYGSGSGVNARLKNREVSVGVGRV